MKLHIFVFLLIQFEYRQRNDSVEFRAHDQRNLESSSTINRVSYCSFYVSANPNVFNFYVYLRTHPLLIRQYIASTAQDKKKGHSVVISGFSYGMETKSQPDKQLTLEDSITPLERQLYFTTAHAHFKAGCPALALEVLSKLPNKVMETNCEDSPST